MLAVPPVPRSTPLVTVTDTRWEEVQSGGMESAKELFVTFGSALNPDDPDHLAASTLKSAVRKKKVGMYSKPVPLASTTYDAATNRGRLALRGQPPAREMPSTIIAADLLDTKGRELDCNNDSQPGGNFIATLNNSGVISMARTMVEARAGRVATAIDAMMADGSFAGMIRHEHGRRRGAR